MSYVTEKQALFIEQYVSYGDFCSCLLYTESRRCNNLCQYVPSQM
jgi:hypothetical protein